MDFFGLLSLSTFPSVFHLPLLVSFVYENSTRVVLTSML